MTSIAPAIAAIFGAVLGSFLGVLVHRVPDGRPIGGRSRCDACGTTLTWRDLVPILSWLVARGRCRTCGARVPATWTLLELGCAGLAALAWWRHPDPSVGPLVAAFLCLLLALAVIDVRVHRLPRPMVLWGVGLAAAWIAGVRVLGGPLDPLRGAIGAALYWGTLRGVALVAALLGRADGMGGGDIRLALLLGLVVGALDLASVGVAFGVAILLGGLAAVALLVRGGSRADRLPFGPMMAAGAAIAALWGPAIVDAYLRLVLP